MIFMATRLRFGIVGTGSIANEGHSEKLDVEEARCDANSSDERCLEYWENHINWWSWDYKQGPDQLPEHRHMPPPFDAVPPRSCTETA